MGRKNEMKKIILLAAKIAIGSSIAIYIAEFLKLDFAVSAGTIALLTLITTKWETVRLSFARLDTFLITIGLIFITERYINSEWISYGLFTFLLVLITYGFGWRATLSVNAVIGTHFLTKKEFDAAFVLNEFLLVLIGICIAVVLNLFHDYRGQKNLLIENMRVTEEDLQIVFGELGTYLLHQEFRIDVWKHICELEDKLQYYIKEAYEYQENTFRSHPGYYIDYFEMRMKQVNILHNLHYEIKRIRTLPKQAVIAAEYILYMKEHITEMNLPKEQIEKLDEIFEQLREEPLPESHDEFESRALLYHILMDLKEFLIFKKRFVESLDEEKKRLYWNEHEK